MKKNYTTAKLAVQLKREPNLTSGAKNLSYFFFASQGWLERSKPEHDWQKKLSVDKNWTDVSTEKLRKSNVQNLQKFIKLIVSSEKFENVEVTK